MSLVNSTPLLAAAGGEYQISRSVRFRRSASAYFSRTPASAGNQTLWTWSGWAKRGQLGSLQGLMYRNNATTPHGGIRFEGSDKITVGADRGGSNYWFFSTNAVFRDPSAWYHIVVVLDTAQATQADRVKIYVNGVLQAATLVTGNSTPSLNDTMGGFNSNVAHNLGSGELTTGFNLDGYLTEINFIDGQALTPSSFGETDVLTGVWKPKKYAGTYGTNGFYLNFSDNASTTTLGDDLSGNGNDWTTNNISLTAGVTYDSMIDTPTPYADGGNGRGNYGVINPLALGSDATLSNANLSISHGTSSTISTTTGTFGMSAGKWYWENTVTASSLSGATCYIGLVNQSNPTGAGSYPGVNSGGWSYYGNLGNIYNNNSAIQTSLGTYGANDVIAIAFDADAGTIKFYKNNTQVGTTITGVPAGTYYAAWSDGSQGNTFTIAANFGQRPFAYTPPTGFKALNTQNLPESTILKGNQYFDATTYTGNGTARNITNSGAMQPDLVWIKSRSAVGDTEVYDAVRGATKYLLTDSTNAEGTIAQALTAFNSDGFALGTGSGGNDNTNGTTYVAWQWKANGAGVSNTDGSITSTVSANTTAGFSIATYTGNSTSGATVGHGLGVAPSMIIVKARGTPNGIARNWFVYHVSLGATKFIYLDLTSAAQTGSTVWNDTAPTSSVFSLGNENSVNMSANNYVAYCFAPVAGYSAFGSYTGNGSADGPFVYTGFRPAFVMIKNTSISATWIMFDTERKTFNVNGQQLYPNLSDSEVTDNVNNCIDFLSNGFKFRGASAVGNGNGNTIIFMAFAEHPFKHALAR